MPVPMRTNFQKAEAKYNVTTEFPSLGLHSAAATGDVGLVEYALNNGQPINSVLDGVLPLHAACAGGNVQVVKSLIDHGADVNAPRLPRKYSNDKNRDASAPIVGTSGSTPLHFAAANGNTDVISLLLLHGAHPDRPDKHGVTPETLAQQNGWVECAKVLREWTANKDRDLIEREGSRGSSIPNYPESSSSTPRRRLHVKQSIDTALNMLKAPDAASRATQSMHATTPPASPRKPFGEYTFYPSSNSSVEPGSRRPSLPHVLQPPTEEFTRNRRPSFNSTSQDIQRRPSSAGHDADRSQEPEQMYPVYGRGGSGRRLGSKYSLLNLFKKGQSQSSDGMDAPPALPASSSDSGSYWDHSSSASGKHIGSSSNPFSGNLSGPTPSPDAFEQTSSTTPGSVSRLVSRVHRGSDASTKGSRLGPQNHSLPRKPSGNLQTTQSPSRGNVPLAVELHMALAHQQLQNRGQSNTPSTDDADKVKPSSPLAKMSLRLPAHNRNRSASSGSMPIDSSGSQEAAVCASTSHENDSGKPSPSPRPGILRAHNRIPSSGPGGSPVNSRTLRFDSSSSNPIVDRRAKDSPRSSSLPLRSFNSTGSLTKLHVQTHDHESMGDRYNDDHQDTHRVAGAKDLEDGDGDEDQDENYGQPITDGPLVGSPNLPSVLLQRQRGRSFTSSSESSLSPILTNENVNATDPSVSILNADFPFSINRPPSLLAEDPSENFSYNAEHLHVPQLSDSRNRGDSLSSNSTSDSRGNMMSSSSTSGSGPSVGVASPGAYDNSALPSESYEAYGEKHGIQGSPAVPINIPGLNERRAHSPLDIDITSISSHAQAEALVERARQEVLDIANSQDASSPLTGGIGRTPLSARLAAYGESLALERKLREQKEGEGNKQDGARIPLQPTNGLPSAEQSIQTRTSSSKGREGVERQLSLEAKPSSPRPKRRPKEPRRPSTAEGLSSNNQDAFFSERAFSHHPSHSTSTSIPNYSIPPLTQGPNRNQSQSLGNINVPLKNGIGESSLVASPAALAAPSRASSIDEADTETDSIPTLHRVTPSTIPSTRSKSSKKLAKMGIPVTEQAAAASRATPPSAGTLPNSKRFGIKSIMQTLKGRP
ncbi:hypothetical protein JR316_0002132 [Psilocybe cubensis]|uniref:Uncharacterized protein n=2 Tax=Psilocybe cubensis TaxID=181762 RepID=A0ACB8HDJ4_PSICU|nr:hypothetical protein JR316_0002132 [Psilocybe cubensis]KAH9485225.1 hypothetical protein JR316_0002132 [Psilocybe cubensis]